MGAREQFVPRRLPDQARPERAPEPAAERGPGDEPGHETAEHHRQYLDCQGDHPGKR